MVSKKLLIVLVGLGLALLAGSGIAHADHDLSFGIRPTKASEGGAGTSSYFSYSLDPGAVLSSEALVLNSGDVPVTLRLYAADGITAVNGGTAFALEGQEPTGVSHWLSLPVKEIALGPGEEMIVPFTITVPSDASPGQHVAGLVVAAPPIGEASSSGEGEGQFTTMVVQQGAVAVVIDVPGPRVTWLEITGTCLKEQDDLGATFVIAVRNRGNIFVKGEGSLFIMDRNGQELASNPLSLETVLPGDTTTFQVRHPVHLADGDYLVNAVLNYEGTAAVSEGEEEQARPPASITGVEINVRDGQPEVGCEPKEEDEALPPASITALSSPPAEGGPPIGRYAAYGAPLLALVLAALVLVRRAGSRRAKQESQHQRAPSLDWLRRRR